MNPRERSEMRDQLLLAAWCVSSALMLALFAWEHGRRAIGVRRGHWIAGHW